MAVKRTNPDAIGKKVFKIFKTTTIVVVIAGVIGGSAYGISKAVNNKEEEPQTSSIVTTAPYVTNDNDFIDDSTTEPSTELENEDEELKSIIDQIMKVEFQPTDTYFQNYDITGSVSDELNALNNADTPETNSDETSYDWYQNGIIDSDKLYEKIIANSKNSGIEITTNVEEITKAFTKKAQGWLDYIKKAAPNYDVGTGLKNIDTLSIKDTPDSNYMSYYYPIENKMEVDYSYSIDNNLLPYSLDFCIVQVCTNKNGNLDWDFMTCAFAESAIEDYGDIDEAVNYKDEDEKIEMLATALDISYDDMKKAFLESDVKSTITNAIEPELKDKVPLVLELMDIACGGGDIPAGCDEKLYRSYCEGNYKTILIKNVEINEARKRFSTDKSIEEIENERIERRKKVINNKYSKFDMDSKMKEELDNKIKELDHIFYKNKYNYNK